MIKVEHTKVYGFEEAVRGARNPLNSWAMSDSESVYDENTHEWEYKVGEKDLALLKKLAHAGSDHGKFMRMITVSCDITAPLYWVAEHDTYKVGTVRNSCSFMHKGVSKPFEINDFSVADERIYYLLNELEPKQYALTYPYETEDYKIYESENGRRYKVYRNGRIRACEFSYTDCYGAGRTRYFQEKEVVPYKAAHGYFMVALGGRYHENWQLHRLVATLWLDNPNNLDTVNHKNGNKGDNSVENLEWMSRSDNIKQGFKDGLFDENQLHHAYKAWKAGHTIPIYTKMSIKQDYMNGISRSDLVKKYNLPLKYIDNVLYSKPSPNADLFSLAYVYENILDHLNAFRDSYLETKDENVFQAIRQILPQGYNVRYTWMANYEVLRNIYHARRNHRLPEWHDFCRWIESLPYSELITEE